MKIKKANFTQLVFGILIPRKGFLMMDSKFKKPDQIREQPMTYGDYAALPEDGNCYELVDGTLELSPSASTPHQIIASEIQSMIKQTCSAEYLILYEIDVILSPYEVRRPDIVMIHRSRMSIVTKRAIKGAPDLVVEVLSESSLKRDKVSKLFTYAHYQIPEYWIVDPFSGSLEQHILGEHGYRLHDVYIGDEPVRSERLSCVSFSMRHIMSQVPDLPDE